MKNEKFLLDISQQNVAISPTKSWMWRLMLNELSNASGHMTTPLQTALYQDVRHYWQQHILWEQHMRLLSTSFMLQITIIMPCSIPRIINPSAAKSSNFHCSTKLVWHKIGIFYNTDLKTNPVWKPRSHSNPWPSSRHYLFLHWKLQDAPPYKLIMPPSKQNFSSLSNTPSSLLKSNFSFKEHLWPRNILLTKRHLHMKVNWPDLAYQWTTTMNPVLRFCILCRPVIKEVPHVWLSHAKTTFYCYGVWF